MKVNKLRDLSKQEVARKIDELKQELFNLRFQLATGQLDNPMRIREVRKDIARAKTIHREMEINDREVDGLKEEVSNLTSQLGTLDNPRRVKQVKKNIAKATTMLKKMEIKEGQA